MNTIDSGKWSSYSGQVTPLHSLPHDMTLPSCDSNRSGRIVFVHDFFSQCRPLYFVTFLFLYNLLLSKVNVLGHLECLYIHYVVTTAHSFTNLYFQHNDQIQFYLLHIITLTIMTITLLAAVYNHDIKVSSLLI
jgi:hypothetical protein